MTWSKRIFDVCFALLLIVVLAPVLIGLSLWLLLTEGGPLFYVSERMKTTDQAFWLVKLRTMRPPENGVEAGVTGGDKTDRITGFGRFLRRTRLDEIPQLWNVLRGDISFVGPRPPLRQYVEAYHGIYQAVLQSRPGITGLATIVFHRHEERLLAACTSPEETENVYTGRCIPRKARLDLIYQRNRSLGLDLWLIARTALNLVKR